MGGSFKGGEVLSIMVLDMGGNKGGARRKVTFKPAVGSWGFRGMGVVRAQGGELSGHKSRGGHQVGKSFGKKQRH